MTPAAIFSIANLIALFGWLVLILLPQWQRADRFIIGILVTLFSLAYVFLIIKSLSLGDLSAFGSLEGVKNLFSDSWVLLAGWIHYIAFDLMTGVFIRKNAAKTGVSNWLVIISLLFTFMLGPAGLLFYLLSRWITTRNYFEENY